MRRVSVLRIVVIDNKFLIDLFTHGVKIPEITAAPVDKNRIINLVVHESPLYAQVDWKLKTPAMLLLLTISFVCQVVTS